MCIAEGFPSAPFLVDRDLTREDGIIRCHHLTAVETVKLGWRVARAIRIVLEFFSA